MNRRDQARPAVFQPIQLTTQLDQLHAQRRVRELVDTKADESIHHACESLRHPSILHEHTFVYKRKPQCLQLGFRHAGSQLDAAECRR